MSKKNIEAVYPLSPMQQGMLFHSLYAPDSGVYFEQLSCTLRGELVLDAFQRAWQEVVNRHDVLRTSFVWKRMDRMLQVVQKEVRIPIDVHDWRGISPAEQDSRFKEYQTTDRKIGFDLSKPPLIRLGLMQVSNDAWYLLWSHHHTLMDGWSMPLLLKEVMTYYEAYSKGLTVQLPPARQYREYITWLQKQDQQAAEIYWRETLRGISAPTPLVVNRLNSRTDLATPSPEDGSSGISPTSECEMHLTAEQTDSLQSLARSQHVTISTLVQAAWVLVLHRYSGEEKIVFGATVSGRPADLENAETMIGLFINTLPVVVDVNLYARFVDWLQELQRQSVEARQYEYSSLVQVQEWSEFARNTPLFESILVFENYPVEATVSAQLGKNATARTLRIENIHSFEQTNFPLSLISGPGKQLGIKISFDTSQFTQDTIKRMLGHLRTILTWMAMGKDDVSFGERHLVDIPMLSEEENTILLSEWNKSPVCSITKEQQNLLGYSIDQLFDQQAERTPDALAVILDRVDHHGQYLTLSYADLRERSNILAGYLHNLGVGVDDPIAIMVERSLEMVVGLFGILKAGGAYIPIDPEYPAERVAFMLEDTKAKILITQHHLLSRLPEISPEGLFVIPLDNQWNEIEQLDSNKKPSTEELHFNNNRLVNIIYTSGSTGKPKGVMVEHRSLVNHALNFQEITELGINERVMQFLSLGFDAAGEEIFPALISGSTLVLPGSSRELSGLDLMDVCERHGVTHLHLPAAYWHLMVDDLVTHDKPISPKLRILVVGGESPSPEKVSAWVKLTNRRQRSVEDTRPLCFINAYGPTEATIAATYYKTYCAEDNDLSQRLPIGRPLDGVQIYLLDPQSRPVPIGVAGEIYIGGKGVTRGYLNRPELTAERFIPDTFSTETGARLYRTGDLGRYLEDGNIEFIGRVDQQVKVRGFRIELEEIENVLMQNPKILSAVVLAREDTPGNKRLVAYITSRDDSEKPVDGGTGSDALSASLLRTYLQSKLPEYMVPSGFVLMDAMPLTATGKIDRRALPPPEGILTGLEDRYMAPRTPVETLLVGIWEQVLGITAISIYDSFFDLGGHSLLATQVASRIRTVFEVELPLRNLFEATTVAKLAELIENALRSGHGATLPPIDLVPRDPTTGLPTEIPQLSYAQQRLWFLDQLAPGNLFYNLPLAVILEGDLDIPALEASLNEIIRRHAVLRTNFKAEGGVPVQVIKPELKIHLEVVDISGINEAEKSEKAFRLAEQEARTPFDLAVDPLLRAQLIRLDHDRHVILLTMHHIVSDGWSMGVFMQELAKLYPSFLSAGGSPLVDLPLQYFDYSNWQRKWLQGEELERQLAYWKIQLANQPRLLQLPTDHPRPAVQSSRGATVNFTISSGLKEQLEKLSRLEGATLFMILLAAYQVLLSRYSGQSDISVGTAIANRNRADIESLIGFFVNTLVMRVDLSGNPNSKEIIKRVRETALGAYTHQDLPFEMLVEILQPARDMSHTPLFQVAFSLQNAPSGDALEVLSSTAKSGLVFKPLAVTSGTAKFDLTMSMTDSKDGLLGALEYNLDLFNHETIEKMVGHFLLLLEGMVREPETPISHLPMLTDEEQKLMLIDWNASEMPTPIDRCAHELFEAHARQNTDAIAVVFDGVPLTYGHLDQKADELSNFLKTLSVGPDVLVGIATDRSPDMVIAILGVMKAGGAYLPLDPSYPSDRLAYMIQDSGIRVLITQSHLVDRLPVNQPADLVGNTLPPPELVCLDSDWSKITLETQSKKSSNGDQKNATPDNLAYVIYTSGSTGRPKGTMLRHRGLSNLTEWQRQTFNLDQNSRILQFAPLSFDASVWETFMALANGATLVLARQEILASVSDLLNLLKTERITTATLPPTMLRLISQEQASRQSLPSLQTVISAGEACTPDLIKIWASGRDFFNCYGPTETTVCASFYKCAVDEPDIPPIGKPVANTRLYVLDSNNQPQPVGVPGELYVSGISLAAGYLNQPRMTDEKFIANPFVNAIATDQYVAGYRRMYKTGDLVRYRSDGNVEFMGRIDQQVKVRGFRIELGEIESVLSNHPQIAEAVVMARDEGDGEQRLIAFFVPENPDIATMDVGELRTYLRELLPEYMLPSVIQPLEAFPLTPSGKVDRILLKGLSITERPDLKSTFVPPRTPTEERLVGISAELLHLEKVGVFDNFFELGGHSLLATQFASRIKDAFLVELPLRQFFEMPTVAGVAAYVDQELAKAESGKLTDRVKLADALKMVGQLSEEQVKALLEQKKSLGK